MQLINNNCGMFRAPTIELRTTEMPRSIAHLIDYRYESCLFTTGDSEVLSRYNTLSDAVQGHLKLARKYNLGSQVTK
jgi:hypothetical protein